MAKKEKFSGRKPDGQGTSNIEEYLAAWDELLQPLKDMGFVIHGFDPDVNVMSADGRGFCQFPLWVVRKIIRNMKDIPPKYYIFWNVPISPQDWRDNIGWDAMTDAWRDFENFYTFLEESGYRFCGSVGCRGYITKADESTCTQEDIDKIIAWMQGRDTYETIWKPVCTGFRLIEDED